MLLEIGLWTSLEKLASFSQDQQTSTGDKKNRSIEQYLAETTELWKHDFVPRLGSAIGKIYADAVMACLTAAEMKMEEKGFVWFERVVCRKVERCCA